MKTNKSFTKRIRVTKNGKLVARKPGHNHYNARESGSTRTAKNRMQTISLTNKEQSRFLPGKQA